MELTFADCETLEHNYILELGCKAKNYSGYNESAAESKITEMENLLFRAKCALQEKRKLENTGK